MKKYSRLKLMLIFFSILTFSLTIIHCERNKNTVSEICDNGIDDDSDGYIDCDDFDCEGSSDCL